MTDPDSFLKRGWLSLALVPVDSTFTMNFMDEGDYKTFLANTPGVTRTVMSRLFHQYPSLSTTPCWSLTPVLQTRYLSQWLRLLLGQCGLGERKGYHSVLLCWDEGSLCLCRWILGPVTELSASRPSPAQTKLPFQSGVAAIFFFPCRKMERSSQVLYFQSKHLLVFIHIILTIVRYISTCSSYYFDWK